MKSVSITEAYQAFNPREQEEFTRVLNKLLATSFLVRQKDDTRRDFFFVQRHEALFREYLALAGWELVSEPGPGIYAVRSALGYNRKRLRLEESIILLIVRLLYEEKSRQVNLTEHPVLRVREIQERYTALKIRQRPIDKKSLADTIQLMKRYNLLENLDADVTDPDCRLKLYPSLLLAVRVTDVKEVFDLLDNYVVNGRAGGEEPEAPGEVEGEEKGLEATN